jgi:deoxyribonuclease-4
MVHIRIGIHTSRAGSLEKAALRAHELRANTFQIFSASPRQWRANPLDPDDVRRFQEARRRFDLKPLAIHVNYLINLASLDPVIRHNSIRAFRGELERAAKIGAEYLVTHPGNYKLWTAEEGIAAFVLGLNEAAQGLDLAGLTVLIENTVGAGAQLGGKFSELRAMRDLLVQLNDVPIGYCLDTCHLFASGFDISSALGLTKTLQEADSTLGLEHVHVIHANDSKGALGSRLDRHANIGHGQIGEEGFGRILKHPKLRHKPFILETPVDEEGDDHRNLEALRRLAASHRGKRSKLDSVVPQPFPEVPS